MDFFTIYKFNKLIKSHYDETSNTKKKSIYKNITKQVLNLKKNNKDRTKILNSYRKWLKNNNNTIKSVQMGGATDIYNNIITNLDKLENDADAFKKNITELKIMFADPSKAGNYKTMITHLLDPNIEEKESDIMTLFELFNKEKLLKEIIQNYYAIFNDNTLKYILKDATYVDGKGGKYVNIASNTFNDVIFSKIATGTFYEKNPNDISKAFYNTWIVTNVKPLPPAPLPAAVPATVPAPVATPSPVATPVPVPAVQVPATVTPVTPVPAAVSAAVQVPATVTPVTPVPSAVPAAVQVPATVTPVTPVQAAVPAPATITTVVTPAPATPVVTSSTLVGRKIPKKKATPAPAPPVPPVVIPATPAPAPPVIIIAPPLATPAPAPPVVTPAPAPPVTTQSPPVVTPATPVPPVVIQATPAPAPPVTTPVQPVIIAPPVTTGPTPAPPVVISTVATPAAKKGKNLLKGSLGTLGTIKKLNPTSTSIPAPAPAPPVVISTVATPAAPISTAKKSKNLLKGALGTLKIIKKINPTSISIPAPAPAPPV
jgi:hypothetical protein